MGRIDVSTMTIPKKPEYSNVPVGEPEPVAAAPASTVPQDIDHEMAVPTPREESIARQTAENQKIKPQRYSITSKNQTAMRVIHDYLGRAVTVMPGETKANVWLQPHAAQQLGRGDLNVVSA